MQTFLEILKYGSVILGTVTLLIGLWQYTKAQHWKRAEFVAEQMRKFEDNKLVRRAMKMLDFRESDIEVDGRRIPFDDNILARAMAYEDLRPPTEPDETEIRLAFCDFFDGLERFHHFVEADLITHDHLRPYLPYWYRRFTTRHCKSQPVVDSIWTFIDGYEYEGVRELAGMFGFTPPAKEAAIASTRAWLAKNPKPTAIPANAMASTPAVVAVSAPVTHFK